MNENKGDDDVATLKLLDLMNDPQSSLESVHEEYVTLGQTMQCRTELHFRVDCQNSKLDYMYVDLMHPKKGHAVEIRLETKGAVLLSHQEHVQIVEKAIRYRYARLVESVQWGPSVPSSRVDDIFDKLAKINDSIAAIPNQPPSAAQSIMKKLFGNSTVLCALDKVQDVSFDRKIMDGLYRLCKRLAERYLKLVKMPITGSSQSLVFTTLKQYKGFRQHRQRRSRDNNDNGLPWEFYAFGSTPTSFRVHVPWAKRTAHYTFSVQAPENNFLASVSFFEKDRDTSEMREVTQVEAIPIAWSIDFNGGLRCYGFLGHARNIEGKMNIGVHYLENPAGSTMRMAILCLMTVVIMLVAILAGRPNEFLSVILAVLALSSNNGVLNKGYSDRFTPLLSKIVPGCIAAASGMFLAWLNLRAYPYDTMLEVCTGWVAILLTTILALWLVGRWVGLVKHYRASYRIGCYHGGTFQ